MAVATLIPIGNGALAITHRLPLEEAVEGYALFEAREAMKVVLEP